MGGDRKQLLQEAKMIVIQMLDGSLFKESNPVSYEEDIPYFAVGYLEELDPGWLMERLALSDYGMDGKLDVALQLRYSHEQARIAIGYDGSLDEFLALIDSTKGLFRDEEQGLESDTKTGDD